MNRRQEERVADLGRAFQEALRDIIDMGEDTPVEPYPENYNLAQEQVMEAEPRPMPVGEPMLAPLLSNYNINIRQAHNGFIVEVGCQTFVFEKFETASRYMTMYFQDPEGTIKKHYEGTLFK